MARSIQSSSMTALSGRFLISSKYRVNFTSKLCVIELGSQAFLHNGLPITRAEERSDEGTA
jgi:hypothetical protein